MRIRLGIYCIVTCVSSAVLIDCRAGKDPLLMAQLCFSNKEAQSAYVKTLQSIAETEGLQFSDTSGSTQRGLDTIGYVGTERGDGTAVLNIGAVRSDGMGFTAVNLGLPGYQVLMGFAEGSNPREARQFAQR